LSEGHSLRRTLRQFSNSIFPHYGSQFLIAREMDENHAFVRWLRQMVSLAPNVINSGVQAFDLGRVGHLARLFARGKGAVLDRHWLPRAVICRETPSFEIIRHRWAGLHGDADDGKRKEREKLAHIYWEAKTVTVPSFLMAYTSYGP
jgi:hypothetical protein